MSNSKFKLSVIICVHNTPEKYFKECLNSVANSTVKNIEIVVIDDGSTVDYKNLLKNYNNVHYEKTENQGTLHARLLGAKVATAPYVCYLDSDDMVSFDYYEGMLAWQAKTKADIVLNDWAFSTVRAKYFCKKDSTISRNFILKNSLVLRRYFQSKGKEQAYFVLWNKLIDRNLLLESIDEIEKLNLERQVFAEDVLITFFLFRHAKCVSNVHLGYYFYRQRPESECAEEDRAKIEDHFMSMAKVFDIMQKNLEYDDSFVYVADYFLAWKIMDYKTNLLKLKHMHHKDLIPKLQEAYGLDKAYPFVSGDNYIYANQKLLPDNLVKIDEELQKIYYNNKYLKIYAKPKSYAYKTLFNFKRILGKRIDLVRKKKYADFVISSEKTSLKNKILHNHFVYLLGMKLVPKGSKLRKKIKSNV